MRTINFPDNYSVHQKWSALYQCYKEGKPIVGTITQYSEHFGFTVSIDGILAHMDKYEFTFAYIEDHEEYINKTFLFKILRVDEYEKKIVVSRKRLATSFQKGDLVQGIVYEIIGNRMHVDVGFLARVHIRDMADKFIPDINEIYSVNQVVDVVLKEDYTRLKYTEASTKPSVLWQARTNGLHVRDVVNVAIDEVKEEGINVSLSDFVCGFVHKDFLTDEYRAIFDSGSLIIGSRIDVAVTKIDEEKHRFYLSMKEAARIQDQKALDSLRSQLTQGDVIEAEVVKVSKTDALLHIIGTDVKYKISRNDLSPNRVIDASDEVFVGEVLPIAYLGEDNGKLHFTRKFHVDDKYEDYLYELSLDQLLDKMDIHTHSFIGRAVKFGSSIFFKDLISVSADKTEEDGKLLIDPVTGKNIIIIAFGAIQKTLQINKFYEITIGLAEKKIRMEKGTPFMFSLANQQVKLVDDPYQEAVGLSFRKYTSPTANTSLAYLLNEVGQNLYTSKKRMFFELLQNADDAALLSGVKVKLQLCDGHFVLTHDGYAFNKHDFMSITSAAKSTKSASKQKTGYKGIGFKSVFTNSSTVQIKSGGFNFCFDKSDFRFSDFCRFYFYIMDIENDVKAQEQFLYKFDAEYRSFGGVKDIPWSLLPIWTDVTNLQEGSIFNQDANVAISLQMDEENLADYRSALTEVFMEPRFMLFLRNTRRIQFFKNDTCLTIQKNIFAGGRTISLVNSYMRNKRIENYRIFSIDGIHVNNQEFEKMGIMMRRFERINNRGEKESFLARIDSTGKQLTEIDVPDRIASAEDTSISFALRLDEQGKITSIDDDSLSLYVYLPMNEHRFHFPFFINADFIPKSDREGIQSDNPWNYFLFFSLGKSIIQMASELASIEEPEYLNLMLTKLFVSDSQDTFSLIESFNKGYSESLKDAKFIINDIGEKVGCNNIIIDSSQLSDYVDSETFYTLIGTTKRLANAGLSSKVLSESLFGIERLSVDKVIEIIETNIVSVNKWIDETTEEERNQFYDWIVSVEARDLAKKIHILQFDGIWYTDEDISLEGKLVLLTETNNPIKEILKKLGFKCSETMLCEHALMDFITKQPEIDLYESIKAQDCSKLSFEERRLLFLTTNSFNGVGKETLKKWAIFKNQDGEYCPIGSLFVYDEKSPIWLNHYMINKEENHESLLPFLISKTDIYSKIIVPEIDAILSKTNIHTIYEQYKTSGWSTAFTLSLISKAIPNIISIVEKDYNTHNVYVKTITTLNLNTNVVYGTESYEYRLLKLATTPDAINHLRSIITINGKPLKNITIKDELTMTYGSSKYIFHISQLLPGYKESSELSLVASKFNSLTSSSLIFAQNEAPFSNVKAAVNKWISESKSLLNSEQFCFLMLCRRSEGYYSFGTLLEPYIRINDGQVFLSILDKCMEMQLGEMLNKFLLNSQLILPVSKLYGTYIDSDDYTLSSERIPSLVKNWAKTTEKKIFLRDLGIHDEQSNEISRRRSFKENKLENIWNVTDRNIILPFFRWVEQTFDLPIHSENQVSSPL